MSWLTRLKHVFDSRQLRQDVADEFQEHLDRKTQDLERDGLTPAEARRQARLAFGRVDGLRDETQAARTFVGVENVWRDSRFAVRALRRRPGFVAVAVLSIGLATSAVAAVLAVINATFWLPLPVSDPDRVVFVSGSDSAVSSIPLFETLRAAAGDAARLVLVDGPRRADIQDDAAGGVSEQAMSQFVTADLFSVLGIAPELGQLFADSDARMPPARLGVVISHQYWTRRFGQDRGVVGREVLVDGRRHTIVGVVSAEFRGLDPGTFIDLWRPLSTFDPGAFSNAGFRAYRIWARLGFAASAQSLSARLEPAFRAHYANRLNEEGARLSAADQSALGAAVLRVSPGRTAESDLRNQLAQPLTALLVITAGILLLACVNVAGLAAAQVRTRTSEITVRLALGSDRSRVLRQFAFEGLALAAGGVALGMPLGRLLASVLVARMSTTTQQVNLDLTFGSQAIAIVLAGWMVAAILVVLPSSLMILRDKTWLDIRASTTRPRRRAAGALVAVQLTCAFALVVIGAAFLVSLGRLTAIESGLNASNVTVLTVSNRLGPSERPLQAQLTRDLQARVAEAPNVQGAAAAWTSMFTGVGREQRVGLPGGPLSAQPETFYRVAPGYFSTLGIPLRAGRDFVLADNDDEPVSAVVNVAFARQYFGQDAPLGRTFVRDDGARHAVVGVVGDAFYDTVRGGARPMIYMPMKPPNVFTLYVRSSLGVSAVVSLVGREAAALGHGFHVRDGVSLQTLMDSTILSERLLASVGVACAGLGLVLGAVGLLGLLSHAVADRTPEIGLRSALGASRSSLYALVALEAARPISIGLVLGSIVSFVALRTVTALLYDVSVLDPLVLGIAAAVFLATAFVAGAVPARRATRIDPLMALKRE